MRYRRPDAAGGTYFFTVNLAEWGSDRLVRHVDDLRVVTKGEASPSVCRCGDGRVTQTPACDLAPAAGRRRLSGTLVADQEADLARHLDYIHYNPVKYGWVKCPVHWPHSTPHGYIDRGVLPADWGEQMGDEMGGYGER